MKTKIVLLIFLLIPYKGYSKVILYGSEYELLTIVYGSSTILRFPAEVKTISQASKYEIKPANTDDPDYAVLAVKPRFLNARDRLVFILNDNSVVKIEFLVIKNALTTANDAIYDLKDKRIIGTADSTKPSISKFELMKALIRGDNVSGYDIENLARTLSSPMPNLKIELLRLYKGENFNGYTYRLSNTSSKNELSIDVRKIKIGNPNLAVLSQIEESKIRPNKNVFLNIVTKSSAQYGNLIFSMEKDKDDPKENEVKQ